jgi:CheY-like chemotaxis protein
MEKQRMLVVEDEDIMREALHDYFSDAGHAVDTASDGEKALEKVNFEDYNVMIIDLKLPGRDGISVLREAKQKNPHAKVIIITAYPSVETEEKAMHDGALNYLPKPFELDYLETLIKQSYEIEIVPTPPVEEPVVEEEIVTPCIWMQAGIVKKRMCTYGYNCTKTCDFHVQMMSKERFRNDPRIKPFIAKLYAQLGKKQCRYVMSGQISHRSCSQLFDCPNCEFDQAWQDEVSRQLEVKARRVAQMRKARPASQVLVKRKPARTDH